MISLMTGGEIFIPKLPSIKIIDLARAIAPETKLKIVGIRSGEKIHEVLITEEESRRVIEYRDYFMVLPEFPFWKINGQRQGRPHKPFTYRSDTNKVWLDQVKLKKLLP